MDYSTLECAESRPIVANQCCSLIVILNKRSLRSEGPVPSLPRESGRAARFTEPALRERKRPKGAFGSLPYQADPLPADRSKSPIRSPLSGRVRGLIR